MKVPVYDLNEGLKVNQIMNYTLDYSQDHTFWIQINNSSTKPPVTDVVALVMHDEHHIHDSVSDRDHRR